MMLLVEEVMALVVVRAVPTVDMGKVTVVMGRDGGDGNRENYRCLPAQTVCRSHSSSLQTQ